MKELEDAERNRIQRRQNQEKEFLEKRKLQAGSLMTEILTDQPDIPKQPPLRMKESLKLARKTFRSKDTSPKRTITRKTAGSPMRTYKRWHSSPVRDNDMDIDQTHVKADEYLSIRDSYDYNQSPERNKEPPKPILVGASYDEDDMHAMEGTGKTVEFVQSTGPVADYEARLQELDQTGSFVHVLLLI